MDSTKVDRFVTKLVSSIQKVKLRQMRVDSIESTGSNSTSFQKIDYQRTLLFYPWIWRLCDGLSTWFQIVAHVIAIVCLYLEVSLLMYAHSPRSFHSFGPWINQDLLSAHGSLLLALDQKFDLVIMHRLRSHAHSLRACMFLRGCLNNHCTLYIYNYVDPLYVGLVSII